MIDKLIELSKLEIFASGDLGRVLFVIVLLVIIIGGLLFMKVMVGGIVSIWSKTCDTVSTIALESKRQLTEQMRLDEGKKKRSSG